MVRTLVLIVATASIVLVGYGAYTCQDPGAGYARNQFPGSATPQPMVRSEGPALSIRGATVRGGTKPYVVVYDADGEPKYQFRSTTWEPVSEVEFDLVDPEICVFMPGGEITRIRADHGRIFVERSRGNNLNPKRGTLRGNVMIFIDRTDRAWRRANPDQAAPERHPDRIVKIWMDEIRFDLDQSYIKSNGKLRVQSPEVEIEGTGLTLAWNERDNRIEELVIEKGRYMELRRGGSMVSFSMPGREREEATPTSKPSSPAEKERARRALRQTAAMIPTGVTGLKKGRTPSMFIRRAVASGASANRALSVEQIYPERKKKPKIPGKRIGKFSDKPARPRKKIRLFGRDDESPIRRKKHQIDTYLAVFEGDVVVEQRRGLKLLGRLDGVDRLELIFDVGEKQRKALRSNEAGDEGARDEPKASAATAPRAAEPAHADRATTAPTTQPEDRTRLRLLWNGRLVLRPVEPEGAPTGKRFDARATGPEVRIMDRQGDTEGEMVCRQLIFSNETEQAWLYGTAEQPVRMWSGRSRRLQGRVIYLDRQTGIALFDGPGSMTDARQALAAISVPGGRDQDLAAAGPKPTPKEELTKLSWTKGAQLAFGVAQIKRADPATGREVVKKREYIKQASFRGKVHMQQGDQFIEAEEVVMAMGVPTGAKAFVGPVLAVRASGGVMMVHQKNEIRSEKLSVTMTIDKHGRNVPKSATAYGNVLARQGDRYIRAKDLLSVVIGEARGRPTTAPATHPAGLAGVDPVQLARVKALARQKGIRPDEIDALLRKEGLNAAALRAFAAARGINPDVVGKLIKPKRAKPRLAIIEMHAFGDVVAIDPEQKLDVQAEELHCSLPDGETIERATVIAAPKEQSRAELGDYVIHGHRIEIDVARQFAEVPDKGWLRFVSRQGLDGRRLDRPLPTKVAWSKQMRLEGRRNVGWFVGDVVASSQTNRLECDRLKIDFVDLPPAQTEKSQAKAAPGRWRIFEKLLFGRSKSPSPERILRRGFDKKPISALAEGNVVVVSSMFDKERPDRLLSRMRIAGPKLSVDLRNDQLDVTGSGSLLIEDYRLPLPRDRVSLKPPSRPRDPLMGDLTGRGPSQTVFTWANSMTYFLANNLAVLDRSVSMIHLGGQAMVMADDLARAMGADVSKLRVKARKAALSCSNLTVEFLRTGGKVKGNTPFDMAGAAELKRLIATGNIYLQDGRRSLVGEELTYFRDKNEITVSGTPANKARLFVEDPKSGQVFRYVAPLIRWNRDTGEIDAPGARIDNFGG